MITIIPFADHEIGYEAVQYLLKLEGDRLVEIPFIYTSKENDISWWPSIKAISKSKEVRYFENANPVDIIKEIDYFLLLSWKFMMNSDWLSIPKINSINLHYSLLPKLRGTNPINWAIINGEKETGITFHEVSNKLDSGRIIRQKSFKIEETDSLKTLLSKLNLLAFNEFKLLLKDILSGKLVYVEQPLSNVYNSKNKLKQISEIDVDHVGTFKEHLNLLRGLSFNEENPIAFQITSEKEKVFYFLKSIKVKQSEDI